MNIPEEKVFSNLDNVVDELESIDLGDGNKLEDILKDLECPFTWNLEEMETSRNMIHYLDSFLSLNPDDMVEGIEEIFTMSCFIKNITLSYFLTMNGQNAQVTEIIDNLKKTCCLRPEETESEELIPTITHVLSATEIFIFLRSNKTIKEKQKFVEDARLNMKSFSNMTNKEKACIHGMKSSVFGFFGHGGNLKALNEAKAALGLDPQEAEWWFINGKLMGRIRRITKSDIDKEEIKMIEKAVELNNDNLTYKVFLADVIREYTSTIFRKTKNQVDLNTYELEKDIDNLNKKALDLYLYCIVKLPSCIKSLSRCAIGLVKLPKKYSSKYFNIAEKAVIMSLKMNPNCPYVHHIAGMIYHKKRTFQDLKKALYHYEKASEFKNFAASLDFLRLKCYLNPDLDPYEDLMKYKTIYKEEYSQIQLKCHLGSYYIFKKRDILTAIQYFNEVLEKDQALLLKPTYVPFLNLARASLILLEIAVNEANLALEETSICHGDKLVIENFITKVTEIAPKLINHNSDPSLIDYILRKLTSYKNDSTWLEGKFLERSGNRSEGSKSGPRNNWRNSNWKYQDHGMKNLEIKDKQSSWREENNQMGKGANSRCGKTTENSENRSEGSQSGSINNWRSSSREYGDNCLKNLRIKNKQSSWREENNQKGKGASSSGFGVVNQNEENYNIEGERNQSKSWRSLSNTQGKHPENSFINDTNQQYIKNNSWRTKSKTENVDEASGFS